MVYRTLKIIFKVGEDDMRQPVSSLIKSYLKWCKWRKKFSAFDENREKNRAFREILYEILEKTIQFSIWIRNY